MQNVLPTLLTASTSLSTILLLAPSLTNVPFYTNQAPTLPSLPSFSALKSLRHVGITARTRKERQGQCRTRLQLTVSFMYPGSRRLSNVFYVLDSTSALGNSPLIVDNNHSHPPKLKPKADSAPVLGGPEATAEEQSTCPHFFYNG